MIQLNQLLKSYAFYIISAFGVSLTIKASVGVSSFNSMNLAFSNAFDIRLGTVTILINSLFLVLYMSMTKFRLIRKYLIQAISVLMFGVFINFFTYSLLNGLVIRAYGLRLLTVALGTAIGGAAIGMIVSYNTITFPVESVCAELSGRTRHTFTRLRYMVDIFSIAVSVALSALYALPLYIREGTLISLLLFSFTMGTVRDLYAKRSEAIS